MRVAVTGANGFVGGATVRRLLARGDQVIAFGRRATCALGDHPRLRYIRWDITDGPIDSGHVDGVVHCAGSVREWGSAREFESTNVGGTANVLSSFRSAGVFVHVSTASVYDLTQSSSAITESSPLARSFVSDYTRTKLAAEEVVAKRRAATVVLRPHIVYGPGDAKIVPRLVRVMRRAPVVVVPGTGRNRLSMTQVDNLVLAIELSLAQREGHAVFNVADGEQATVDELLIAVQSAFGIRRKLLHAPAAWAWLAASASEGLHRTVLTRRAPTLTRFLVMNMTHDFTLDVSRARDELGYRPVRSYREALVELAAGKGAERRALFA